MTKKSSPLVDNGFSGVNVNRDGFQKMMKLIRQGKIRKVIVYKLDRMSRSLADFVDILQEFKLHDIKFVSSQESFDTSSPYGEMIVKLLVVFAEFERTSIIERVTQAYAHRSEMGFYMGGRQPYGFELVPTVIHNIKTKKINPIPSQVEQIRYIYEVYAQESVSLCRLLDILIAENKKPWDGSDWSDMKLVLLTHQGIVGSDIWLKCQSKLSKNKQITNRFSNNTSWLAGKIVCEKCRHHMTTVKTVINNNGEIRRYFNCMGKSHQKICTGTKVTIYAEDLENMVYDCITEKLSDLKEIKRTGKTADYSEINDLKLKLKTVEQNEKQLIDTMLAGGLMPIAGTCKSESRTA